MKIPVATAELPKELTKVANVPPAKSPTPDAESLGLKLKDFPSGGGAMVLDIVPESAAARAEILPGDIVTQNLPGNLAHITLVSDELNSDQSRPLVIHNIGAGAKIEDTLLTYEITGHYRYEG